VASFTIASNEPRKGLGERRDLVDLGASEALDIAGDDQPAHQMADQVHLLVVAVAVVVVMPHQLGSLNDLVDEGV